MKILRTIEDVRNWRKAVTGQIGLVPTMGALHQGHLSLVRASKARSDLTLVSIFVNPTQFGPNEDLNKYPRPIEDDLAYCEAEGVDAIWMPEVEMVYPSDEIGLEIDVPELTCDLEGAKRKGHFSGVCRVVAKLFAVTQPDQAYFGRKDFQQLRVIEALNAGLSMGIEIIPCNTVREPDGLALSSRNTYLSPDHRKHALGLSLALKEASVLIKNGESDPDIIESAMTQVLKSYHCNVDYAVVRDIHMLRELDCINLCLQGVVCLIAARVGDVRLIDNMHFPKQATN